MIAEEIKIQLSNQWMFLLDPWEQMHFLAAGTLFEMLLVLEPLQMEPDITIFVDFERLGLHLTKTFSGCDIPCLIPLSGKEPD
jgi:hypothetical protein